MTRPTIDHDTWILVADGQKALFLRNDGDDELRNFTVCRVEEQDNPPTRDQGADRPGRMGDAGSAHRSAVADTDWHQLAEDRFAKDLGEMLYKMAHKNRFQKLVIVAPPRILGELRHELHKEVLDRVVGEVPKTLTNHPIDRIETLLGD
ncbi:host attachment family protein [Aurantimonas sp. A2-1-M11]|uniref:host attachment family protein n=1 Tax=Aurantimonas sp. A2-1-M11 TaxID=3113712 RepID=UPI002F937664